MSKNNLTDQQYANMKRNTRVMQSHLAQPCVDCNLTWHPLVMTFDHVDRSTKVTEPSKLRTAPPAVFDEEVAKCEVVCRNCHQIREYLRDLGIQEIGDTKRPLYKYYERLIPYLCGGAMLRRDAFELVPIGHLR